MQLTNKAKEILDKNWRGKYTVPSPYLYPHQWSWDSAFISIGYSHYDLKRAENELMSLFEGQWRNGMLPHIVFRKEGGYFPTPDYWNTKLSSYSAKIKTSGLTQPPVHGIAAWYIYKNAQDKNNAKDFLKKMFPKILDNHHYLLTKRDPEKSGLVTIFHPWESGFDNSTRWDEALTRFEVEDIPLYRRIDIQKIDSGQRPTNETYDRYIYLIEIMKKNNYDEEKFYDFFPFKIKDVVFSTILYIANQRLLDIAEIIGEEKSEIESWIERTKENYFKYFCIDKENEGLVYDYDLVLNDKVRKRTVASLIPIYTDLIGSEHIKRMFDWMMHSHVCSVNCIHKHKLITAISVFEKEYNPLNYWRGPIWININWMLYRGLRNHGFIEESNKLLNSMIDLVYEHGFYEYYNPSSGEGLGSDDFSWTAALMIDILSEERKI